MINQSGIAERKETMIISNVKQDGAPIGFLADGEIEWHFDKMHQPVPNIAAVLHAGSRSPTGAAKRASPMPR